MNWNVISGIASVIAIFCSTFSIGLYYGKTSSEIATINKTISKPFADRLTAQDVEMLVGRLFNKTCELIDSGYSKTIIFSKNAPTDSNHIVFHANQDQEVEITIFAESTFQPSSNLPPKVRIIIDEISWGEPKKLPYTIVGTEITKNLKYNIAPSGNIHTVKFVPVNLTQSDRANIKCVILVKNRKV